MNGFTTKPNDMITPFNGTEYAEGNYNGLTKREYFAGQALILLKLMAENGYPHDEIAKNAVSIADCLIEELNK